MPKFDYEKIQRDLRTAKVARFRASPFYSDVPLDQADSIEKRYIDGIIRLPEFTVLIESIRNGARQ